MKTSLLCSAALVIALAGLNASAAFAGEKPKGIAPKLVITGNMTGTYHWYNNSDAAKNLPIWNEFGYGTLFAVEDSNLYFNASGRMDNGWTDQTFYDWLVNFSADAAETKNIQENRIQLKSRAGTLMFGNTQGVENIMARGAYSIPGGTGGFDGNFKATTIRPSGLLLTTDMVGATKYATKLTYVSPRVVGLQAGVSYAPNSEHRGDSGTMGPHFKTSTKNPGEAFGIGNVALAVNYVQDFNQDLSVAVALTSQFGKAKSPKSPQDNSNIATAYASAPRHNIKSYAVGGVATYKDFEFGVEWINNGKSLQVKNAPATLAAAAATGGANPNAPSPLKAPLTAGGNPVLLNGQAQTGTVPTALAGPVGTFNAGQAFSVAAAYSFGFNKVSAGYYHSTRKFNGANTKGNIYSLDYDRAIAPGFSVFAEGVLYDLKGSQNAVNFTNALAANSGGPSASTPPGVLKNDGQTLLLGAITKF